MFINEKKKKHIQNSAAASVLVCVSSSFFPLLKWIMHLEVRNLHMAAKEEALWICKIYLLRKDLQLRSTCKVCETSKCYDCSLRINLLVLVYFNCVWFVLPTVQAHGSENPSQSAHASVDFTNVLNKIKMSTSQTKFKGQFSQLKRDRVCLLRLYVIIKLKR